MSDSKCFLYAIRDHKAQLYIEPFPAPDDRVAERRFGFWISQTKMAQVFPEDFELFRGTPWGVTDMYCETTHPTPICRASDFTEVIDDKDADPA